MKNLIVSVHPDDETLGAGGSIHKLIKAGEEFHWLIITDMHPSLGYSESAMNVRSKEIEEVSNFYGFNSVVNLGFPTTQLDAIPNSKLISAISKTFHEIKPNRIFLPHFGDAHSDHTITFNTAYSCTKSFRAPFIKEVYAMETLSETDFAPPLQQNYFQANSFFELSKEDLDAKQKAMKMFKSEWGNHPFPRSEKSIESLAILRGVQANCNYAEAFICLKRIVN